VTSSSGSAAASHGSSVTCSASPSSSPTSAAWPRSTSPSSQHGGHHPTSGVHQAGRRASSQTPLRPRLEITRITRPDGPQRSEHAPSTFQYAMARVPRAHAPHSWRGRRRGGPRGPASLCFTCATSHGLVAIRGAAHPTPPKGCTRRTDAAPLQPGGLIRLGGSPGLDQHVAVERRVHVAGDVATRGRGQASACQAPSTASAHRPAAAMVRSAELIAAANDHRCPTP
jgi:hypothetical protein